MTCYSYYYSYACYVMKRVHYTCIKVQQRLKSDTAAKLSKRYTCSIVEKKEVPRRKP